ncbi:hypothetical protein HOLleu_19435 [Holothuria leucospilota]|uniref:Sulfotransferase n=1 Tax=Holothuria leucospilota TaxID=206669 RepID=A0A9Q1H7T4_HOLLE|nr:hypothetical protein HOLleu_19435 [Holothuria leucospilota]
MERIHRVFRSPKFMLILLVTIVGTYYFSEWSKSPANADVTRSAQMKLAKNANSVGESQPPVPARKTKEIDPELVKIVRGGSSLPNYFLKTAANKEMYRNATLSFVHYPKGGGTTMKECITKISQTGNREPPLVVFAPNAGETKEQLLNGAHAKTDIFMGTYGFSLCQYVNSKNCAYFTILRDPYDRMVSHYFFCRYGGGSNAPCNKPIEEFAVMVRSVFFHQLTCIHKCKQNDGPKGPWSCDREQLEVEQLVNYRENEIEMILDYAEQHLEDIFVTIGLLDEFDTSLALLQEAFGLPFYDMCRNSHRNGRPDESEERKQERIAAKKALMENEEVKKVLHADIRLYNRAKELFQKQKEKSVQRLWEAKR